MQTESSRSRSGAELTYSKSLAAPTAAPFQYFGQSFNPAERQRHSRTIVHLTDKAVTSDPQGQINSAISVLKMSKRAELIFSTFVRKAIHLPHRF